MILGQLLTIDEARGSQEDALLVQGRVQVLEDAGEGVFAGAGTLNCRIPGETPQLSGCLCGVGRGVSRDNDARLVEVAQLGAHRLRRQVDGEASQHEARGDLAKFQERVVEVSARGRGLPGHDRHFRARPAAVRELLEHPGRLALDADSTPERHAACDSLRRRTRHGEHRHGPTLKDWKL